MKSYSLLSAVVMLGQTASAAWTSAADKSIVYTSVPGFFLQDDNSTSPTGFDYVSFTMLRNKNGWLLIDDGLLGFAVLTLAS